MTTRPPNDRARPATRGESRPTPHKGVARIAEPRAAPEHPAERAARPVRPRTGPPRPRGVR